MKFKDIAELSVEDREAKVREMELELMKERAQIASGTSPKNPGNIKELRRTIARINMLRAREKN